MNEFSVNAILEGRKTQTRRVMKPQPVLGQSYRDWIIDPYDMDLPSIYCPWVWMVEFDVLSVNGDRL
jgi:hypothetical protein